MVTTVIDRDDRMKQMQKIVVRNSGLEFNENGRSASLQFQHLFMRDFDATGEISMLAVAKLFEMVRGIAWNNDNFLNGIFVQANRAAFIVVGSYNFKPELYNRLRGWNFRKEMKVTVRFMAAGKSSLILRSYLIDTRDNKALASLDFKYVTVSRTTRKALTVPGELREQYASHTGISVSFELPKFLKSTPPAFSQSVTVMPTDTDVNGHNNNNSFLRYIVDCASVATSLGKLPKHFNGRLVKKLNVLYRKECHEGDKLEVKVWMDEEDINLLHFIITKESNEVFNASMTFMASVLARL